MTLPQVRDRTPDRPGPGPTPASLLRALDITLARRVQGIMPGEHKAPGIGGGIELAAIRPYVTGDDVRTIDWNVTARMREAHVRVPVAERALTTWLLLDTSASMHFGTADRRKADVAEGVALVIGQLATKRANRLGVFAFGGRDTLTLPPRQGRTGLLGLLLALREEPPAEGGGATSLGAALRRAGGMASRNGGLVVLVSDFRGPQDWLDPLRSLRARHSVLAVEVRDPREMELPAMGVLALVDPETGRQIQADTRSRKLRERFAAAAASEREQVAQLLRDARVDHAVLSTSGEWLRPLAKRLGRGLR
ncbi:MAG TPA: DUF58 domain-containing protein [Solirubrobacteraceae bacterium]|nr:DUF58 domain-containing protein [Solirubrobacteraceae bacterium]